MAKAPKLVPGTFVRIPLTGGSFGYGRALVYPYMAFYNYRTNEPSDDLDEIESKPVLFKQSVRILDPNRWTNIGRRELKGEVAEPVVSFMQDLGNYRNCTIFDTAGMERQATPEECVGLERAAVWDPHHIEQRLLDTFEGRPNEEEERLRVRLS